MFNVLLNDIYYRKIPFVLIIDFSNFFSSKDRKFCTLNLQTIVAFANTAGGTLVIGIKDKTKEVVGLSNVLEEEERIANLT